MMILIAILLTLFVVLAGAFAFVLSRRRQGERVDESLSRMVLEFQREMSGLRSHVDQQLIGLNRQMNEQLKQNADFIQNTHHGYRDAMGQVQHRLGELQQVTQSMIDVGKDISSLQDILRAPKLRGGLGELFLGELLRQILPADHFTLQYSFRDGRTIVDAVIEIGEAKIPVDAKFPIENFRRIQETTGAEQVAARKEFARNVKKHINDIAAKYIRPEEGTFDFALMYIPAENIYYETIIKDDQQEDSLSSYALSKRIIPVSPNSFYAYLQAIVRGLKGMRIESSAQRILESLGQMEADFGRLATDFDKVGKHLSNAQSAYAGASKTFDKLRLKLSSLDSDHPKKTLMEETVSSDK